jgi:TfoX/Sxy family transcriptional regulator of competence genes
MAYDEDVASRVRELLQLEMGVTETDMFGGRAFLIDGNIAVAASDRGGLTVCVDPDDADELVEQEHVQAFEMDGKPAEGWLRVDSEGLSTNDELESWVKRGVKHARSLSPKE